MKLVHSWAKDFVAMPKPERVRQILDGAGLPVEGIGSSVILPATVVVGHILEVKKHPNADRLRVTQVDCGEKNARTIVCGAPNVAVGQRVCVALPGTLLPNNVRIEVSAIRGVTSEGMLCAADELGLGSDHAGILLLPEKAKVGGQVDAVLPHDIVYDVEVMPNRPDCLSVYGLAREIAAAEKKPLKKLPHLGTTRGKSPLKVLLQDKKSCPFYSAQVLSDVHIRPSPEWMQKRLRGAGIRPISAPVDITNYVMLETGQPLHAFNADALEGDTIVVRCAKSKESFLALDGVERVLEPTMLVIADPEKAVAIAGVMGGEHSGIQLETKKVILESALFHSTSIYRTSRSLKLASESSARFSRGIDPNNIPLALSLATKLFVELCGATPEGGPAVAGRVPRGTAPFSISVRSINALLGSKVSSSQMKTMLKRLGIVATGAGDRLRVTPPSWRHDILIAEDIAEEVVRSIGYNAITRTVPPAPGKPASVPESMLLQNVLAEALVRTGAHEHVGYSYVPESLIATDKEHAVRIINPLSRDQEFLRTSLLPGLYVLAARNAKRYDAFRIFEFGKEYRHAPVGFEEKDVLACLWVQKNAYRSLVGMLESIGTHLYHGETFTIQHVHGRSVAVTLNGNLVGMVGMPTAQERAQWKVPADAAYAVLDLDKLAAVGGTDFRPVFRPIPQYPAVKRDLAFWVDSAVHYKEIDEIFRAIDPLLVAVVLFDVYRQGERISLAFHLTFLSPEGTLEAREADAIIVKLEQQLARECNAQMRRNT